MRILVVEDERKLAQALASALKAERYEVVLAPTGEDGSFQANAGSFDQVVLSKKTLNRRRQLHPPGWKAQKHYVVLFDAVDLRL